VVEAGQIVFACLFHLSLRPVADYFVGMWI